MSGNISSPRIRPLSFSKYDVAIFIDEKGDTRWKELVKEFVDNGLERHISRQKLSDYLKELCNEGLVSKTIDKTAFMLRLVWRIYPIYVVPKSRKKRIEEIRQRKKIYEFVDTASQEEIKKLDEAIGHVEENKI